MLVLNICHIRREQSKRAAIHAICLLPLAQLILSLFVNCAYFFYPRQSALFVKNIPLQSASMLCVPWASMTSLTLGRSSLVELCF